MPDILDQSEVNALLAAVDDGEVHIDILSGSSDRRSKQKLSGSEDDVFRLNIKNYQRTGIVFSGDLNLNHLERYAVQAHLDVNKINAVLDNYKFEEFYEIVGHVKIRDRKTGDVAYCPIDRIMDENGARQLVGSLMDDKKLSRYISSVEKADNKGYISRKVLMRDDKKRSRQGRRPKNCFGWDVPIF